MFYIYIYMFYIYIYIYKFAGFYSLLQKLPEYSIVVSKHVTRCD